VQAAGYRDHIVTLLGQFPDLSAVKVLRKLKERLSDLGVSECAARRYITALRETVTLRQRRYYEPVESACQGCGQVVGGVLSPPRWGLSQFFVLSTIFLIHGIIARSFSPVCSMGWAALSRR